MTWQAAVLVYFCAEMRLIKTIFLLAAAWHVSILAAQTPDLERLTAADGLSQGMIFDVVQDKKGFLWFATNDGLNRYDGYGFKVYQNDPFDPFTVSRNEIQALHEDQNGRLWVGTLNNGVSVRDPKTDRFYHLKNLSSQNIRCFAETPDGSIWIGTDKGVNRVQLPSVLPSTNPDLQPVAQVDTFYWDGPMSDQRPSPNVITDLVVGKDGKLWVSSDLQIGWFDPVQVRFQQVWSEIGAFSTDKKLLPIYLFTGPDGSVWVGHPDRLLHIQGDRVDDFPLPIRSVFPQTDVVFDAAGNLFVSTRKQIFTLSAAAQQKPTGAAFELFYTFAQEGIIGSTKMLVDRGGLLWIGTNGFGVRKHNPGDHHFHHLAPNRSMRRILPDSRGRIWAWQKGVFYHLGETDNQQLLKVSTDLDLLQHDCLELRNGEFWLLCENTADNQGAGVLVKINPQSLQQEARYPIPGTIGILSQFIEARSGKLCIAGDEGKLITFNPHNGTFETADFSTVTGFRERAYCLQEDIVGHFWLGTPHGLVRGIPAEKGMTFSLYKNNPKDRNSLNCDVALVTMDDAKQPERFLWIGTKGGGLNQLDKMNGQCKHFTKADGLPNNVVYGILPDPNGAMWLSTNYGLSKFDPNIRQFQNFFAPDGLQDNEFNTASYARAADGRLFFGGVNGLTAFYPQELAAADAAPIVYLTALKIQNHSLTPGDGIISNTIEETTEITLAYYQNQLTFEFAAMDFSAPQQNQFRYRLLGADDNWVEPTTVNAATYANLAPGNYVFELITGGSHGVWDGTPLRFTVHILPPWWRSTWAYLLYLIGIMAAFGGVYRFQVNKIQLQNKLSFEQREAGRLAELDRLKTNFFNSITHEFRTPLTLLLEPARQLLAETKDRATDYRLQLIEKSARRLLHFVNQLLDLSKLEAGQMPLDRRPDSPVESVRMVLETFQPLALKNNVVLQASFPNDAPTIIFDRNKFEQVISNLFSNALKFTGNQGSVDVTLKIEPIEDNLSMARLEQPAPDTQIILKVSDTGIGIPTAALPLIFDRFYQTGAFTAQGTGIGLALTKELVERMGGSISVASQESVGTTFTVVIPAIMVAAVPQTEPKDAAQFGNTPAPDRPSAFGIAAVPLSPPELLPANETAASEKQPLLLLVEDDAELRQFLRVSLPSDYRIAEAANGAEGILMALELVPDLIISDLMMPEKDGFEVCTALKNDQRSSHIPFILLTAKSAVESKIQGLQYGADAYLTKPFRADELVAYIENLLTSRRHLQQYFRATVQNQPVMESVRTVFEPVENKFLQQVMKIVEDNLENDAMDAETFARSLFMSRSQLHRKISALTGLPLTEFVRNYRLDRAHQMLSRKEGSIAEVAWRTGFPNPKYFSTCFRERFGQSPSLFKSGGAS